jgi:energy-coupling factor transporter ATP-binding protein EcfA2
MTSERYQEGYRMWAVSGRDANRLSALDLVRKDLLDTRTAAVLWLLMERSSLIVASGPQLAGKTTLLTALLDLMPPSVEKVYTRGSEEDFSFLEQTGPSETLVLVPEFSDHTPAYLWGSGVRTLFDALEKGYRVAGTMHADTPEDILGQFTEVGVPRTQLHHVGAIVNIRVETRAEDELDRSVSRLTLVGPGPSLVIVGELGTDDTFSLVEGAQASIADHLQMPVAGVDAVISERSDSLTGWLTQTHMTQDELSRLATAHYGAA